MSGFHTNTFLKYDDYMTPNYVWDNIIEFIPKNKKIWECFYGDGKSGDYLKSLGLDVIHEKIDFFKENKGEVLISNPPFSRKKEVFTRLKKLDKPFIMICPSSMISTKYMRELYYNEPLQIIIPARRIQFIKDGLKIEGRCNFNCFYYCYKLKLPKDIIYLFNKDERKILL